MRNVWRLPVMCGFFSAASFARALALDAADTLRVAIATWSVLRSAASQATPQQPHAPHV